MYSMVNAGDGLKETIPEDSEMMSTPAFIDADVPYLYCLNENG